MQRPGRYWVWMAVALAVCLGMAPGSAAASEAARPADLAGLIEHYDSSSCRECHPAIYEQWSKSHHARPLMGLNNFSFLSKYLRKGPLAVPSPEAATLANFPCAKCHLPQLLDTDDRVAKELAQVIWRDDKTTLAKLNIGCLVCHRDKAVVHQRPDAGAVYGAGKAKPHEGAFVQVKQSRFMSSPAFCGQCHGLGPNFEFTPPIQCATLYGSYLHAYVANGGAQTCLDCHMTGKDHTFPPNFADKGDTAKRYRAALPMEVEVLPYAAQLGHGKYDPMLVVRATIRNNAGHRLPDG